MTELQSQRTGQSVIRQKTTNAIVVGTKSGFTLVILLNEAVN